MRIELSQKQKELNTHTQIKDKNATKIPKKYFLCHSFHIFIAVREKMRKLELLCSHPKVYRSQISHKLRSMNWQ